MKILLAVHQFFPEFRAGTETLVLRTAQELRRRGHQVTVLCGGTDDPSRPRLSRSVFDGLPVFRCNPLPPPSPMVGALAKSYDREELLDLHCQVLEHVEPDLLHVFHLRRLTLSLLDAASMGGVPVLASLTDYWMGCTTGQLQFPDDLPCSGPDPDSAICLQHLSSRVIRPAGWLPLWFWRLVQQWASLLAVFPGPWRSLVALAQRPKRMREAYGRFAKVLVPSELMLSTFVGLGFPAGRTAVCPYGIDVAGLDAQPMRLSWPRPNQRALEVGFIGSFNYAKGAHILLQALARLPANVPVAVSLYGSVVENPAYGMSLQREVSRLPRARLAGVFEADAIFAVLARLDVLVVPSLWRENAPLVLLQAMASGLPVLVSDVAGMADQIQPGLDGLLFPPGDSVALAEQLEEFCRNPASLAGLIHRARRTRTIQDYVDDLEVHYRGVSG